MSDPRAVPSGVRVGVDVGGTFTDLVALTTDGGLVVAKVPSTPTDPAEGLWTVTDRVTSQTFDGTAPEHLIHGTTVATNALLERSGGRVALAMTAGFEDLLWLRRQDRAGLYDLALHHPPPLVDRADVVGVRERTGSQGILQELTADEIQRVVAEIRARAPDAVAVCLLFGFRDLRHERALAGAIRRALPNLPVAASHEVLPVFREYERTSTTTAEAFLRPKVSGYVERLAAEAGDRSIGFLRVMASTGGTLNPRQARHRAASLALSGPAGGVEGATLVGRAVGFSDLLTLDMGGTSADASIVVGGEPVMEAAGEIAGVSLALPHILIETVGAGGGSVAWVDAGGALRVGPRSAGAVPGPAAYGQGGEDATVTDAALVAGWLAPEHPLAGDLPLVPDLARRAVERVANQAGLSLARCADGILQIATSAMARALRKVSVVRGVDPRGMTLVAFGGAGPLFACRLAETLGMRAALIPPHPGVLSALGLAAAPDRIETQASVHHTAGPLSTTELTRLFAPLDEAAALELPAGQISRYADCRYPGQGYEVSVPVTLTDGDRAGHAIAAAFHDAHQQRYGHHDPGGAVEIVNIRVVAARSRTAVELTARSGADRPAPHASALERLAPGAVVNGPATIAGFDSTARIEAGWVGRAHASGALVLERP